MVGLTLTCVLTVVGVTVVERVSGGSAGTSGMPMARGSVSDWRFLESAAPHYTTLKLRDGETIEMDGKLDDAAWSVPGVEWTTDLVVSE